MIQYVYHVCTDAFPPHVPLLKISRRSSILFLPLLEDHFKNSRVTAEKEVI